MSKNSAKLAIRHSNDNLPLKRNTDPTIQQCDFKQVVRLSKVGHNIKTHLYANLVQIHFNLHLQNFHMNRVSRVAFNANVFMQRHHNRGLFEHIFFFVSTPKTRSLLFMSTDIKGQSNTEPH